jgi:O-acetyl-ADP-ribose deacetylase (regulator of RNase III)
MVEKFNMHGRVELTKGDITKQRVDAVVNAANTSLLGGGGVDGAIHRAGGQSILEECIKIRNRQGGCTVGEAVITTAGNMPAKFVIHTVGPVWSKSNTGADALLSNAYRNSLQLAAENNIKSIAFPNISTGIYHFPKDKAAEIAIRTVKDFLSYDKTIEKVIFVCFDEENYDIYQKLLSEQSKTMSFR